MRTFLTTIGVSCLVVMMAPSIAHAYIDPFEALLIEDFLPTNARSTQEYAAAQRGERTIEFSSAEQLEESAAARRAARQEANQNNDNTAPSIPSASDDTNDPFANDVDDTLTDEDPFTEPAEEPSEPILDDSPFIEGSNDDPDVTSTPDTSATGTVTAGDDDEEVLHGAALITPPTANVIETNAQGLSDTGLTSMLIIAVALLALVWTLSRARRRVIAHGQSTFAHREDVDTRF